jgi:hypothetical protein
MANRLITSVLGFGLVTLLISGCSTPMPQRIEVSAKPVDKPELVLPNADALRMREVDWTIITPENFEEKIEEIKKTGRPVVFFALTDKGYENLGLNFSDIRAYIQQQKAIIAAYENYYKNANEALDKANANIDGAKQQVEAQQKVNTEKPSWQFWN